MDRPKWTTLTNAHTPNQVYEEIGYEITPLLSEHSSIFTTTSGQKMKLYVIPGHDPPLPEPDSGGCYVTKFAPHKALELIE